MREELLDWSQSKVFLVSNDNDLPVLLDLS